MKNFDITKLIARTAIEPRPYQIRIANKAITGFLDKGFRSIMIESPTASGKTISALLIAQALSELKGLRIGWVAMRRHLLKQVQEECDSKKFDVQLKVFSMFDKAPPPGIDVLIVDEAQHDATASMAHIHSVVNPKYILGLSATPFRADRVKLCFDNIIKDAGIASLIADGYLSKFHHYTIPTWTVDDVTNLYIADQVRWGKSIMYFHKLAQCAEAKARLLDAGITCDVVSGASDTDSQLEDFFDGKIKVLVNCMKLSEGFNAPDLKTVFCRPSCRSVTIQMAGRVLRKCPDYEFKQIVQSEKTPHVFTKTALAALQHVQHADGWRTLEVNPHIENINRRCIMAMVHTEVKLPKLLIDRAAMNNRRRIPRRGRENSDPGSGL